MQDTNLRVTFIQTNLLWEDIDSNLKMLSQKIEQIGEPTDIIVLPEMFSTGFSMNTEFAQDENGSIFGWLIETSKKYNSVITGSIMFKIDNEYKNRLVWITPDGDYNYYDKRHLFGLAGEDKSYTCGKFRRTIDYKGWKICPLICYDLRFPNWSRNLYHNGSYDYDLLIYVANWPEKRSLAWNSLLTARAIENQCYVVGVNRIGIDRNEILYSGDSGVWNFLGEKISSTTKFESETKTVQLSLDDVYQFRTEFPFILDAD